MSLSWGSSVQFSVIAFSNMASLGYQKHLFSKYPHQYQAWQLKTTHLYLILDVQLPAMFDDRRVNIGSDMSSTPFQSLPKHACIVSAVWFETCSVILPPLDILIPIVVGTSMSLVRRCGSTVLTATWHSTTKTTLIRPRRASRRRWCRLCPWRSLGCSGCCNTGMPSRRPCFIRSCLSNVSCHCNWH